MEEEGIRRGRRGIKERGREGEKRRGGSASGGWPGSGAGAVPIRGEEGRREGGRRRGVEKEGGEYTEKGEDGIPRMRRGGGSDPQSGEPGKGGGRLEARG